MLHILVFSCYYNSIDNDFDYVYYGFPGDEKSVTTESQSSIPTKIRNKFPETWLWIDLENIRLFFNKIAQ